MSSLLRSDGAPRQAGTSPLATMHRDFVLSPITAVALYTSSFDQRLYLLAGEDNHVKVYDIAASKLCVAINVFPAQQVHGVRVTGGHGQETSSILIWGGFCVTVLSAASLDDAISSRASPVARIAPALVANASDWVFDGAVSPHVTSNLALLGAHNDLMIARCDRGTGKIDFIEEVSPSRPILYSGNVSWETPDTILVAAGTVFGEIVLWRYTAAKTITTTPKTQEHASRSEVLFVFSGHEGSIFGVHISPIIHLETGEDLRLLASCSDDRTIRIWDITDPKDLSERTKAELQQKTRAVRETGFGDTTYTGSQEDSAARCLAVAMGHVSRIWNVEFTEKHSLIGITPPSIDLWSFGEDATAQKWSLTLGNTAVNGNAAEASEPAMLPTRTNGQLRNEAIYANHSGKNIWSHAKIVDDSGQLIVVTGASDGKLSVISDARRTTSEYTLADVPPLPAQNILEYDGRSQGSGFATPEQDTGVSSGVSAEVENSAGTEQPATPKLHKKKQKVKKPSKDFFNRYAVLPDGTVLASTKIGRFFVSNAIENSQWNELFLPDQFRRGDSSNYAVVKSAPGASVAFVGTAQGDVFMFHNEAGPRLKHLTCVHGKVSDIFPLSPSKLLVAVLGSERACLVELETSTSHHGPIQTAIPVDKRFVITSATLCRDLLILGSRTGYISILGACDGGTFASKAMVEPKTNDCVTSITLLPTEGNNDDTCFLTTSRDGRFRIFTIREIHKNLSIKMTHETSPPFGPIIEGAWVCQDQDGSHNLILFGFRSTKFVVWNETQRKEIAAIECGGGHRTFVYRPLPNSSDAFQLVWTRASQLRFFSQTQAPHRGLKSGGHGREIKAVSASGTLLATAAEDTAIRIWSSDKDTQNQQAQLRCLAVLEDHTTGIQSMKWYRQSHLFSSAGNKEFFVWRIQQLNSAYQRLAVKCEAVYPDRTDDIDLRILNFDVHCLNENSQDEPFFYISMVLSNSALLTYTYSEATGFKLIVTASYTGACMTQVRHLYVDETTIQTLTAATDGYLTVWESKTSALSNSLISEYSSVVVTRLHQSALKSLDIRALHTEVNTSYIITTGGDDNALGIMHLLRDIATGSFLVQSKSLVRSAHAAAVTGIGILHLSSHGRDAIVVSCSNDQRVKRWKVGGWQSAEMSVKLLDNKYSAVADAGDLEVLEGTGKFVVGGVGLEIWNAAHPGLEELPHRII